MTPEQTLIEMLTYCRPMGSATERAFVERFLLTIPGAYVDSYRNVHVERGEDSRVLFSAHTDTVHWDDGRQRVHVRKGTATSAPGRKGTRRNCLGADDTAGCFIMRELALANVPGRYVFHFGEERGGIGSSALAEHCAEWLSTSFDYAIAFDRRGTADIITHQAGMRGASDTFAKAFAKRLRQADPAFRYRPSPDGIYTDTAEYAHLIAECCNVSVGYRGEHGSAESLDVQHVLRLARACRLVPFADLPVDRDPADDDPMLEWSAGYMNLDTPVVRIVPNACEYLDPEWEDVQRALQNAERAKARR